MKLRHHYLSETLLRNTIRGLIIEGRIEDFQAKYPHLDVVSVNSRDPSGHSKYLSWMLKQLEKGHGENDLYPTVEFFHDNLQRFKNKDINSYNDLKDLEDVAKSLPEKSKTKQKKEIKSDAPKVYEDDYYVVVRPDTKQSCMVYGANTKWCITMGDASYYEQYTSQNVIFYFILSKNRESSDPLSKIAIAMMRDKDNKIYGIEYYDAQDDKLNKESVSK